MYYCLRGVGMIQWLCWLNHFAMERIPDSTEHEKTLALRNEIEFRLGRLDPSATSLISTKFLLELAEAIKDRKLGMWRSPSALETAAMSVRSQGLVGAIESARPMVQDDEFIQPASPQKQQNVPPVPATFWRVVLFVLDAAQKNASAV